VIPIANWTYSPNSELLPGIWTLKKHTPNHRIWIFVTFPSPLYQSLGVSGMGLENLWTLWTLWTFNFPVLWKSTKSCTCDLWNQRIHGINTNINSITYKWKEPDFLRQLGMFPVFIPFPSFLLKNVDWQCSKANRSSVIASNKRSLALAASLMEIWPPR